MDTGLNNTNRLHEAIGDEIFKDVEWIVDATSDEQFNLWGEYSHESERNKGVEEPPRYVWEQISRGLWIQICELDIKCKGVKEKLPVCISFSFAKLNGHKICFYTSDSLVSHHGFIEAFLLTYFQRTHDGYTRWNHVDATNFHNCANYLDTVDAEARDTKYKPEKHAEKYFIFP